MHKLVVLYPAPEDANQFLDYYENTHLPLVASLPGILSFSYAPVQGFGSAAAPYFVLFEACFDSHQALMAALQSPQGRAVAADVPNYSPGGATMMHLNIDHRSL